MGPSLRPSLSLSLSPSPSPGLSLSLRLALSSWGVFERPADISKAYGGGKKICIGGFQEDEEERKRKQAAMDAMLK